MFFLFLNIFLKKTIYYRHKACFKYSWLRLIQIIDRKYTILVYPKWTYDYDLDFKWFKTFPMLMLLNITIFKYKSYPNPTPLWC